LVSLLLIVHITDNTYDGHVSDLYEAIYDKKGKSMKNIIFIVCAILAFAVNARAIPYTWVDTINFSPDRYIGYLQSTSYTHDITDNSPFAFTPGFDKIYSYNLKVKLYDDGGRCDLGELAFINQPGILGDGFYTFTYSNENFGWSIAGLMNLNQTGKLDVSVTSVFGDFYLDYSQLTAIGNDVAPVPEPGTMVLLGFGLVGIAIYGKRRMNKDD